MKLFPVELFDKGYDALLSVIPPGAVLSPRSTIPASAVGKIPGIRQSSGVWSGHNWRAYVATAADVRRWVVTDNASVGLRTDRFPCLDIDALDEGLVSLIEQLALEKLGPAVARVGRPPKKLLLYRLTGEPFAKIRLWIKTVAGADHLVEMLGAGNQAVVHGIHPVTGLPYQWLGDVPAALDLTPVSREQVAAFFDQLAVAIEALGIGTVTRSGDGRTTPRIATDQTSLRAPSIEALRAAVALIPNTDELFPGREDYVKAAYAIRAAAGDEYEHEGYEVFAAWAGSHESDGRVGGNSETWLSDWRRLRPPFALGWGWIAELARGFGYNDAAHDFEVVEERPTDVIEAEPENSDQWLARKIVERQRHVLRFVPQRGCWLVWERGKWQIDAELLAEDIVKRSLNTIANDVLRRGATGKEKRDAQQWAIAFCSGGKATTVAGIVRSDRGIAISVESLDSNQWVLNTPGGIVDLKTGALGPSDPEALCSKATAVVPEFGAACPEWRRFLHEATAEDIEVQAYLQRLAGYCLTGSTREQQLTFIWGDGGNGKSVFLNVLSGILGDYCRTATMDTFTSGSGDKHSTDVAMLQGARLITASETEVGKKWNEARIKQLTGSEPVTARYMRQDNFTFIPQGKPVFTGNHRPELRTMTRAMRRRIHLVPFNVTPKVVDMDLGEKLQREWPAILAWMIEGCLLWQEQGLQPPKAVLVATEEYFAAEDAIGQWAEEWVVDDPASNVTSSALYQSWREWAGTNGEQDSSMKRLTSALVSRKWVRWREPETRRMGFAGKRLINRVDFGIAT